MDILYRDYVLRMTARNPTLNALSTFLQHPSPYSSVTSCLEINSEGQTRRLEKVTATDVVIQANSGISQGTITIIENVHSNDIEVLGSGLDIDPFFFSGHIASSYEGVENSPPQPHLVLPPSRIISQNFFNLYYHEVLDLGPESRGPRLPYTLAPATNIFRPVRCLPALSGRSIGLMRGCISVLKKNLPNGRWICIILVDPSECNLVTHLKDYKLKTPQVLTRIKVEDFRETPLFSTFRASGMEAGVINQNLREYLLGLFQLPPLGCDADNPNILSMLYYPLQIVISEWMLYVLLMSRYVKYYEYSFQTVRSRLEFFEKPDIRELHRWRRRSQQSLHKLRITRGFIEYWRNKKEPPHGSSSKARVALNSEIAKQWDPLLMDIQHLEWQIIRNANSLESLGPIITAMVQLIASHESIYQAEDVRRLTYIAIAFIPLSFLASLFSMSDPFGPAGEFFWVYWAAAIPIAIATVAFSVVAGRITTLLNTLGNGRGRA